MDARIRRWQRISELAIDDDELREVQAAVKAVCEAPRDPMPRARLRTLTDSRSLHDQAFPFLSVAARTQSNSVVLAALRDVARPLCDHVYRPVERLSVLEDMAKREPDNASQLERLAWMYYLVGAWVQAGETLERLAPLLAADHALVALRAAGRLYRNSGRNDLALVAYRAVALRKPADVGALTALAELMVAPHNAPDSRFDPQQPPSPTRAATRTSPRAHTRPGSTTQVRGSAAGTTPPINQRAPTNTTDLFASLDDDEIDGSLAFAFGDDDAPPAPPPEPPAAKPTRQTQERDGLLRPPAPPSNPTIDLPPERASSPEGDPLRPASSPNELPELPASKSPPPERDVRPSIPKIEISPPRSEGDQLSPPSTPKTPERPPSIPKIPRPASAGIPPSSPKTELPLPERAVPPPSTPKVELPSSPFEEDQLRSSPKEIELPSPESDQLRPASSPAIELPWADSDQVRSPSSPSKIEPPEEQLRRPSSSKSPPLSPPAPPPSPKSERDGPPRPPPPSSPKSPPPPPPPMVTRPESPTAPSKIEPARPERDNPLRPAPSSTPPPYRGDLLRPAPPSAPKIEPLARPERDTNRPPSSPKIELPPIRPSTTPPPYRGDLVRTPEPPAIQPPRPERVSASHTVIDLDEIIDAPVMALPSLADLDPTDFGEPDEFGEPDDFGEIEAEIEHLEQLLAEQRARGAIRECAEICEQLARLVTDDERRRVLVEEAIAAYVATGNPVRADALASWLRGDR